MKGEVHIDFEGLAAFINGELPEKEARRWEEWVAESPENARIYRQALKLLEPDPGKEHSHTVPFDSSAAWKEVEVRLDPAPSFSSWWKVAAVFALIASLAGYWAYYEYFADVIYSQTSGISEYYLPDSSKVVLNGKAKITFDRNFNSDHRNVSLEGQAYFDVRKDSSLIFEINTPRGLVRVLGTAFLVEETKDSLYVLVDRGIVGVSLKKGSDQLILERNEEAVIRFSDERIMIDEVENTNKLYWANRRLTYRRENLAVIFDELAEIFDVTIQYDPDKVKDCSISAVFLDQSLNEILENISLSLPVQYTISGNQVEITTNGCNSL
jgi:transmembrane sensor